MPGTHIAVHIPSSGSPVLFETEVALPMKWASASSMLSGILGSSLGVTAIRPREFVFLTRSHQRAMDRALRRSVKIIS